MRVLFGATYVDAIALSAQQFTRAEDLEIFILGHLGYLRGESPCGSCDDRFSSDSPGLGDPVPERLIRDAEFFGYLAYRPVRDID